ncbi:hypothetical protein, partial [Enterococcus faecalis]
LRRKQCGKVNGQKFQESSDGEQVREELTSAEAYENILINCFRYLEITDLSEIERMTLYEYEVRLLAFQLKRLDHERDLYLQSWLNNQIKATKGKKSEPYYKEFNKFFNYEEREKLILGKSLIDEKVDIGAIDLLRKANK